ncbi:3-deoxy-7-phosphoheptulonate synthase [Bacillota bacterium LX-D]|nr:3-deoxy-7-phosphoheptulonate synthase [Bacillota bacterium LX-D]
MIVVMDHCASQEQIQRVLDRLTNEGFKIHLSQGDKCTVIGVIGEDIKIKLPGLALEALPGVEKVVPILQPYKLAGRDFKPEGTKIKVGNIEIGGNQLQIAAGPCAVESREQLLETAWEVKEAGATILRGGAYKPRTSPYSFQGLGEKGLKLLAEAKEKTGLAIITEATDTTNLKVVAEYADIIQIGARNMQNFHLLKEAGKLNKPVLLKRGPSATIEEWILAAEYIMMEGNYQVIFCERGIRTFETYTRNTLDLSSIPVIKKLTHLPIFADPSHGTGKWHLVDPMARASIAAGADGLIVEIHPRPSEALSDGFQSLTPDNFKKMMTEIKDIGKIMKKEASW